MDGSSPSGRPRPDITEADTERRKPDSEQKPDNFEQPRKYADMVDEASDESFPASNPPAHGPVD